MGRNKTWREVRAQRPLDERRVAEAVLLTAEDVSDMLGMTRDWVYAEVRANRIPHIKLGRCVRFRRESIENWLVEQERSAPR